MDETVVFLMREYGWTYEYTANLIRTLPIAKLRALLDETAYQRERDQYRTASYFALVIASFGSTKQKRLRVKDIIGQPPQRRVRRDDLRQAAAKQGIKLPGGDNAG